MKMAKNFTNSANRLGFALLRYCLTVSACWTYVNDNKEYTGIGSKYLDLRHNEMSNGT